MKIFSSVHIIRIFRNKVKSEQTLESRESERLLMETIKFVNNNSVILVHFRPSTLKSRGE